MWAVVTFSALSKHAPLLWQYCGELRLFRFVYLARKSGVEISYVLITGEILCTG